MDKKTRIAQFLAQGFKPAQVASIVGVTPAYISQLAKEPGFAESYQLACSAVVSSTDFAEEDRLNNKYLAAEHLLLDSLTGNAAMMDPRDQIKALEVVATRQEKRQDRLARLRMPERTATQNVINISLPQHALPELQINSDGEIVAIGQRLMAPMSSNGVKNLFSQMKENATIRAIPQELKEIAL